MNLKRRLELVKGLEALRKGELDRAADELKKVVLDELEFNEIYISLGSIFREKGEAGKAIHIHESLLSVGDLTPELRDFVYHELFMDYKADAQHEMACDYLERVMSKNRDPKLYLEMAFIKIELKKYDEAVKYLNKYRKLSGNDVSALTAECNTLMAELEPEGSSKRIKLFITALKYYPAYRRALYGMLETQKYLGKSSKVHEALGAIINNNVIRSADDLKKILDTYYEFSNVDDFFKVTMRKIIDEVRNPWFYIFASEHLSRNNEKEKALKLLTDYVAKFGRNGFVVRKYADLSGDTMLGLVKDDLIGYFCTNCSKQLGEYADRCPKCSLYETIRCK